MKTTAFKKMELSQEISTIPEDMLDEIYLQIDRLLKTSLKVKKEPIDLRGVWKGTGLEKIENLELQVHELRKELGNTILSKNI